MSDLEELKELLFGDERRTIVDVSERVSQRELRARDVGDVLPDAIDRSYARGGALVDSMEAPVGECVQRQLRDEPQTYADALYPVIGPAIRKSISHALRNISQQINQAVEHSLTPKGLAWRFQAARAGIPFGEFLLQRTLKYRVEQAYLICRENGLLVEHVHHPGSAVKDSDAVSAMFTAIQDFVKESFSPDRSGRLESADMGEFTLWAVHGPHALLVCVVRGVPPKSLRAELSTILERIHFRFGDALKAYSGDVRSVPGAKSELRKCIEFEAVSESESGSKRPSAFLWLLALAIIGFAAFFGYQRWISSAEASRLADALGSTPGIYVTELRAGIDGTTLRGLRDPAADTLDEVLVRADVSAERVTAELDPYLSLDEEIVLRRVAAAGAPDGISYELANGRLAVSGEAPADWINRMQSRLELVQGVTHVDFSQVRALGEVVPAASPEPAAPLPEPQRFFFRENADLLPEDADRLADFVSLLSATLAAEEGGHYEILVRGSTDGFGNPEANALLAGHRADVAVEALGAGGIDTANLVRVETTVANEAAVDAGRRYVEIRVQPTANDRP